VEVGLDDVDDASAEVTRSKSLWRSIKACILYHNELNFNFEVGTIKLTASQNPLSASR
jgi:hypothetical protein